MQSYKIPNLKYLARITEFLDSYDNDLFGIDKMLMLGFGPFYEILSAAFDLNSYYRFSWAVLFSRYQNHCRVALLGGSELSLKNQIFPMAGNYRTFAQFSQKNGRTIGPKIHPLILHAATRRMVKTHVQDSSRTV